MFFCQKKTNLKTQKPNYMKKLAVIPGANLMQAVQKFNEMGLSKEDLVSIFQMPNSREVSIVYWKNYETK